MPKFFTSLFSLPSSLKQISKQGALTSRFLFALSKVGQETALKKELALLHPELLLAYSRPGFLTFKSNLGDLTLDFTSKALLLRGYGLSLGPIKSLNVLQKFLKLIALAPYADPWPWRLQVFGESREFNTQRLLGDTTALANLTQEVREEILNFPGVKELFHPEPEAKLGDLCLSVILLGTNEYWLGLHRHTYGRYPTAGGYSNLTLPAAAPSRAYLKFKEAVERWRLPLHRGDVALEIGAAPGGTIYALLEAGLKVVAVDPAPLAAELQDPAFLAEHFGQVKFATITTTAREFKKADLPDFALGPGVEWLLIDINLAPRLTLTTAERLLALFKSTLLGALLTLKLTDLENMQEVHKLIGLLQQNPALQGGEVHAKQLEHHKSEVVIYVLTQKGRMRAYQSRQS